jgi:hypothetical protein
MKQNQTNNDERAECGKHRDGKIGVAQLPLTGADESKCEVWNSKNRSNNPEVMNLGNKTHEYLPPQIVSKISEDEHDHARPKYEWGTESYATTKSRRGTHFDFILRQTINDH